METFICSLLLLAQKSLIYSIFVFPDLYDVIYFFFFFTVYVPIYVEWMEKCSLDIL